MAGKYDFGIYQKTTGAVVGAAPTAINAATPASGDVTAITTAIGANAGMDKNLNGSYKITVAADGTVTATNSNGKSFTGSIANASSDQTNIQINFGNGSLGTLTFEIDQNGGPNYVDLSVNGSDLYSNINSYVNGQEFDVSGAKTSDLGTTKFYASMGGASDVEVRAGDTSVTFDNGITLKFGKALTSADLAVKTSAAQAPPAGDNLAHADDTTYAGVTHASGSITVSERNNDGIIIQTGANQGDELNINVDRMDTVALGISLSSIGTRTNASHAITDVNNAINMVSTQRAALGALQNRLDHKIANLKVSSENLQAAESRIRDVDMASEMTAFTKNNILSQAATAMLAQANSAPQNVLSLLR